MNVCVRILDVIYLRVLSIEEIMILTMVIVIINI